MEENIIYIDKLRQELEEEIKNPTVTTQLQAYYNLKKLTIRKLELDQRNETKDLLNWIISQIEKLEADPLKPD